MSRADFAFGRTGMNADTRSTFITKTYMHLLGAVLAFIGIEYVLLNNPAAQEFGDKLTGSWMIVLGAYMVVSWVASYAAHRIENKAVQYLALAAYVVVNALIFLPLLMIARGVGPDVIFQAAMITLSAFFGLTAIAFLTRKNFSFLRGILMFGGILALVLIACSFIFGLTLGVWFSVAMVALAGGMILYDTSNIIHEYPETMYIGAALSLFASLSTLFWYVLRLVIAFSGDD